MKRFVPQIKKVSDTAEVYAVVFVRHVDAGYSEAIDFTKKNNVRVPMIK